MSRARIALDHVVIAAASLDEGHHFLRERLHVDMGPGGSHRRMGTHNRVMRIEDGVYLELIAVDPAAPAPDRPRWFDLDNPWLRRLLSNGPRVLTWVLRVDDLETFDYDRAVWGASLPMQRDALRWLITVPEDGRLPGGGLLPTLMQWQCTSPVESMPDTGCRLKRLVVHHPNPSWFGSRLETIGGDRLVEVEPIQPEQAAIELVLETPASDLPIHL